MPTARGTIFVGEAHELPNGWRGLIGQARNGPTAGRWFAVLAHYVPGHARAACWIESGPFERPSEAAAELFELVMERFDDADALAAARTILGAGDGGEGGGACPAS